jgi:pre-mRNA-splicing factor SYF1
MGSRPSRLWCGIICCVVQALALRRPALLSAVMLRQNPHNVAEWHKRVNLFKGDPTKQVRAAELAVRRATVHFSAADGLMYCK